MVCEKMIDRLYVLQLERGFFTPRLASKMLCIAKSDAKKMIREMLDKGFVREVEGKKGRYMLSKKGRKMVRVGLTGGCFDILHAGHIKMLESAKKLCDVLVVVIASDETIIKEKNRQAVFDEKERKMLVGAIKYVDFVIIGSKSMNIKSVIERVKPDIIIFGKDQKKLEERVKELIPRLKIKPKIKRIGTWVKGKKSSKIRSWLAKLNSAY
ncbi:MAG TPA: FAD synthase [Candidatus Desulfofervidus auxilii]|uniref:FAD synthase n=1 Tax=Desulfofervidus auxilii TaxID=1621989 RepID=A0A7V0I9J4_DESA2|nr:MAG: hypothetical protein DRP03_00240 [Candidatus Aenigmarchaeota archaeon]HDD35184.1 FAD synthase [Candidatus Desulfofervidus auxilii]